MSLQHKPLGYTYKNIDVVNMGMIALQRGPVHIRNSYEIMSL